MPTTGPARFGNRAPGCRCEYNLTCRACVAAAGPTITTGETYLQERNQQ